ncbi:MAG: T9SS type A sorting domain-containing protein, partial [Candidatus Eiseniibacteriota bacterium]
VYDRGIRVVRLTGQWREKCSQCAVNLIDINTEPSIGVYDFSDYFSRLDYVVFTKGMKAVVSFNLGGRLDTDPTSPGAQAVLPTFLGPDDVMMYRPSPGVDAMWTNGALIKAPRIDRPSTRRRMLEFAGEVVREFQARYGSEMLYYSFSIGSAGENEYPFADYPYFCDTSPDAAAAFRIWLASRYGTPQAVAAAWGHAPPFATFGEIQILDGQASPPVGSAPQPYLDFMAFREYSLARFFADLRDTVHANSGSVLGQFGSVWDAMSATRGTYGFGRMINGYDLVLIDDAPTYDHFWSMDYARSNAGGVPFGNEADAPCNMGCTVPDINQCCYPWPVNPLWSRPLGAAQMDAYFSQSYGRGATWVDTANWDNWYDQDFAVYSAHVANAVTLASQMVIAPVPADTQLVSLRDLYVHHHDQSYLDGLITTHTLLGGQSSAINVRVLYDLDPGVLDVPRQHENAAGVSLSVGWPNPTRGRSTIHFTLARSGRATLHLLDPGGREVRTLIDGESAAGEHTVNLDARGLASGVYLVRLDTEQGTVARKMALVH